MQRFREINPQSFISSVDNLSYETTDYRGPYPLPLVRTEETINYVGSIYSASMVDRVTPNFRSTPPPALPVNPAWRREVALSMTPGKLEEAGTYQRYPLFVCDDPRATGTQAEFTAWWRSDFQDSSFYTLQHTFEVSLEDFWEADASHRAAALHWLQETGPQALKTAVSRARAAEWDLLTTLAERKATVQYIVGRTRSIAKGLKKLLNDRRLTNRRSKPQDITAAWLEFRFAIRPLIVDIQSAIKALQSIEHTSRKGKARITGTGSITTTSSSVNTLGKKLK